MPRITVNVTLNEEENKTQLEGNFLKVDKMHVECDQNSDAQEIVFILQGLAGSGDFHAHDHLTKPGLKWGGTAPSGIDKQPTDPSHSHVFKINNRHNGTNTRGVWDYQLFATVNGNEYATLWYTTNGTSSTLNPSIKNK